VSFLKYSLFTNGAQGLRTTLRLAGEKSGHPARDKKNLLQKVRRNEPKITKMLSEKTENQEIAAG